MANIQQHPERPRMDHMLLEELLNGNAHGSLEILIVNPGEPPANQVVNRMTVQMGPSNAERLLQGVTSDGDGVLHIAARSGDTQIVSAISQIWSNVVDVAARNKRGETALHCAAATGNVTMITLLISLAGDDREKIRQLLRMKNKNGETCLHDAVRFGEGEAVERLVREDVRLFVGPNDSHALVKIHDNEGVSPLYLATTLRQLEIVKFLTAKQEHDGIEYPAASYEGPGSKTALHAAVLLSKDLSEHLAWWNKELIEKADNSGSTPLHLLAPTKNKFTMERLLYIDPSAGYCADAEGSLPIHVAAANGSLEIVKLLSDLRLNCSWSCNDLGQTILHIAVQNGSTNVVYYVCFGHKFSRIFNTRDANGNTALHLAVLKGDQLIFYQLIRRREVCLSFTNNEERTPLDLAQLSLPPGISLIKGPQHWIMHALVVVGADYGTCRSDHLSMNVARPDKEKELEAIGKSAGLVAVCAVLILTTAFAAPFSLTKFFNKTDAIVARQVAYSIFVMSDAFAFGLSAAAICCSTLAGFSFSDRGTRLFHLAAGVGALGAAAVFPIFVFAAGVYLVVGPVVHTHAFLVVCLFVSAYPIFILPFTPTFIMVVHVRALLSRIGFQAF